MKHRIQKLTAIAYRGFCKARFLLFAVVTIALMVIETSVSFGQPKRDSTVRGSKQYELANHLGNVLATVSDSRMQTTTPPTGTSGVTADLLSAADYYAFGMEMPGKNFSSGNYRFGFNGKENDNEVKGEGNQQDYGMRIYDPRIGKFLSVDLFTKGFAMLTPYQFASNTPIQAIDLDGNEARIITTRVVGNSTTTSIVSWQDVHPGEEHGKKGTGDLYLFMTSDKKLVKHLTFYDKSIWDIATQIGEAIGGHGGIHLTSNKGEALQKDLRKGVKDVETVNIDDLLGAISLVGTNKGTTNKISNGSKISGKIKDLLKFIKTTTEGFGVGYDTYPDKAEKEGKNDKTDVYSNGMKYFVYTDKKKKTTVLILASPGFENRHVDPVKDKEEYNKVEAEFKNKKTGIH